MFIMKKFVLILCVLLLLPLLAAADGLDTPEALVETLRTHQQQGDAEFEVTTSPALFTTLSENDFAEFYRYCYLSGVKSFRLRHNRTDTFMFSSVQYGSANVAECATREDAQAAIQGFMSKDAQDMTLLCTSDLFNQLYSQGGLYRLMAEVGVEDFKLQGTTSGACFISEIVKSSVPYATCSSVNEAGEKAAAFREQNAPAFNLLFDPEAYAALTRDDYRLIAFLVGVDKYRLSCSERTAMLYFTDVTYTDVPGAYCTTEEDVVNAIRAMGAQGHTSFQLKLDQTTYQALYANSFARLYELQAQAGMSDGDLRFSSSSCLFLFDNAVISSDTKVFASIEEVIAFVDECVQRGDTDINMLMTAEVYSDLMSGVSAYFPSDAKVYDLIANSGIFTAEEFSFNRQAGAVHLKGVQYYAGTNILRGIHTGTTMTAREMEAYDAAVRLAELCKRDTPVATAQAIHDALCGMIVYTNDESTTEDDCCIGALLNGEANCDGYADAMLLVGRLAGLNVRYQHGDSLKGGFGSLFETHMWNLIELDGTWRMIDATWDDTDAGVCHLWFNIGEDRAATSHVWSPAMTVPMQPVTDASARPVAEYFATSLDGLKEAARQAQADGHKVFDVYMDVPEGEPFGAITTRYALMDSLTGSIRFLWVDSLSCVHVELGE